MAKANWKCPNDWTEWSKWLAAGLHARNRWRLPVLLTGILFAVGLRTVTSWLRAVGVSDDFQDYYYFLAALGRKAGSVATQLFLLVLRTLPLPAPLRPGQRRGRGRPPIYGKNRISLAKRAGHKQGWETIDCTVYGKTTTKTYKTFLATYEPVGGEIRVVIVKEQHDWFPFFSTDPNASVVEIVEAFADRATIEQDFHDVKEVWGAGQQQVRNIWTNVAVYHLNLWMHTLVELWAWYRPHKEALRS